MSHSENALYIFEPFLLVNVRDVPIEDLIDAGDPIASDFVHKALDQIYRCGNLSLISLVIYSKLSNNPRMAYSHNALNNHSICCTVI